MPGSAVVRELERKLGEVEPRRRRDPGGSEAVATGLPALDGLLPRGGLPRGGATEWNGPRSCGKTALLRAVLSRLREEGEAVALVDARRTLYAPDWTGVGTAGEGLWVVRPPSGSEAAWCADILLRSGAFGGVALVLGEEGPPGGKRGGGRGLRRSAAVRLQRLAEEAGSVFVAVGSLPVAALRLRFRPGRVEPLPGVLFGPFLPGVRTVWARVMRGGEGEVPVLYSVPSFRPGPGEGRDRKGRG